MQSFLVAVVPIERASLRSRADVLKRLVGVVEALIGVGFGAVCGSGGYVADILVAVPLKRRWLVT